MMILDIFYFLCPVLTICKATFIDCDDQGKVLSKGMLFCLPRNYSKVETPFLINGVIIWPALQEIVQIDIRAHSITFKMYFHVFWTDSRIILNEDHVNSDNYKTVNIDLIVNLWIPDPYIYRQEQILEFKLMSPSTGLIVNGQKTYVTAKKLL